MAIDLEKTLGLMLQALEKEVGAGRKKFLLVSEEFLASNKERFEMIAKLRLDGELTEDEFVDRLNDEKMMLEAQLNTLRVLAKAAVQKAVNAAFGIFEDTVKALII